MVGVTFQEEEYSSDMWAEFWPLYNANSEEVDDAPVAPSIEVYNQVAEAGALRIVSARIDGGVVGYLVFFLSPLLHRENFLAAQQDALFLVKEHRRGSLAKRLILYAEEVAKGAGAKVFRQSSKLLKKDISNLLRRMGYVAVEVVHEKELV